MTKITLAFTIFCCLAACANTQGLFGFGPSFGIGQAQLYQNYVIQAAANKLTTPGLPEDLQVQVAEALANAEIGFAACDELLTASPVFWQYKKCSAFQLRNVLLQLAAIEQEATLRNSTTPAANE